MATIERIFLDLDDVLNDFTMPALYHVGCPRDSTFDPKWKFDIIHAASCLHPCNLFSEAEFWGKFDAKFWADLPKSEICDWLLIISALLVGKENVCVLSAPIRSPSCMAGKLEWIQANLPAWMHRQFLVGPMKRMCANENSLLIDDSDRNVDLFRANGGQAVLIPKPWNTGHGNSDCPLVRRVISDFTFSVPKP
jgi:5'(3')-deoxyribonucleotidase